ncbi:DUF4335 domain-containing protein [Oxynema sp. CENA135]|uniref:DUF4335 domain-containing protein n=1 Tax=Oxynema sp. CENA135 TaxID=984206 RepID=UPI00190CF279|nr:DUF4335 domain-containing protein [Oxynema sp. CENA135]MBK4732111.1 DUF4335 domain-containing protein [Oxynema sp. CENA135]
MPSFNSVLRRYTPPTCTLEIRATSSPLSRWVGQPVVKNVHFQLRFDAPQIPEEQQVTLRGDGDSLQDLYEAVSTYVRDFIGRSPVPAQGGDGIADLVRGDAGEDPSREAIAQGSAAPPTEEEAADRHLELVPEGSGSGDPPLQSPSELPEERRSSFGVAERSQISLHPKGLVAHELHLGELATEESGAVVHLGTLQLFDLASALDSYASELTALPDWGDTSRRRPSPVWLRVAAIALLTVGVGSATWYAIERPFDPVGETAGSPVQDAEEPASSETISSLPSPPASPGTTPEQTQPPTTFSSPIPVPSEQPSAPPPPPIAMPQPAPQLERTPEAAAPPENLATRPAPREGRSRSDSPGGSPTPPPDATGTPQNGGGVELRIEPAPESDRGNASTSESRQGQSQGQSSPPNPPRISGDPTVDQIGSAPPTPTSASPSPVREEPPPVPDLSEDVAAVPPEEFEATSEAGSAEENAPNDAAAFPPARSPSGPPPVFNEPSSVREAQQYFQERWQPPSGFEPTLEYRLKLNADGSIAAIDPLGEASKTHIDITGIPLLGEPFVSPWEGAPSGQLRLVLKPDGTVETFWQSSAR